MRPLLWGVFLIILLAAVVVWALYQAGKTAADAFFSTAKHISEHGWRE
jgi:hypothetical protein